MPNKYKTYSTVKENNLKHELEEQGWFVIRAAGSFGIADLVALRPEKCGRADHFQVRFVQVKTDSKKKNTSVRYSLAETLFGDINLETVTYPHQLRKSKA